MIKLNLVSENLKNEIKLRRVYGVIKKTAFIFLFIVIIYSITLLFSRLLILNKFEDVVAQTTLITKNAQSYNSRVREINSSLDFVTQAQENFIRLSCFLGSVKNLSGPDISLDQIIFNREKTSVIIRGKSKTRDQLLDFKQKLEKSGWFSVVDLPLKNLLTREEIDFEMTAAAVTEKF
ncbi:MAG: hypothetical protein WC745_04835 [Patescibacteria group bacterium]|jgi:hypothetical protein